MSRLMSKKSRLATVVSVAAFAVSLSAGSVFAGEVTGNGKPLWTNTDDWSAEHHELHGKSLCAFSGQEDGQFEESPDFSPDAGHAQSWGQIPKAVRDGFPDARHPGNACNPNIGLEE